MTTLTEAYLESLNAVIQGRGYSYALTTCVDTPIVEAEPNLDPEKDKRFRDFLFPDGRNGLWWIEDRIKSLFKGLYWKRMNRQTQLEYVIKALKGAKEGRVYGWSYCSFLISLFDPEEDLHTSRKPEVPCLVGLGFYPQEGRLYLTATWRTQFIDTKAYGNLISLAMLLQQSCEKTGFAPESYSAQQTKQS